MATTFKTLAKFLLPPWAYSGEGVGLVDAFTSLLDDANARLRAGFEARFPARANADALALIASDRGIARGASETDAEHAERLARWRTPRSHRVRGSGLELLRQMTEHFRTSAGAGANASYLQSRNGVRTTFTPTAERPYGGAGAVADAASWGWDDGRAFVGNGSIVVWDAVDFDVATTDGVSYVTTVPAPIYDLPAPLGAGDFLVPDDAAAIAAAQSSGSFTVAARCTPVGGNDVIFGVSRASDGDLIQVSVNSDAELMVYRREGTAGHSSIDMVEVEFDVEMTFVLVVDGENVDLWVNGSKIVSPLSGGFSEFGNVDAVSPAFMLGANDVGEGPQQVFGGVISEAVVYPVALSPGQVRQLHVDRGWGGSLEPGEWSVVDDAAAHTGRAVQAPSTPAVGGTPSLSYRVYLPAGEYLAAARVRPPFHQGSYTVDFSFDGTLRAVSFLAVGILGFRWFELAGGTGSGTFTVESDGVIEVELRADSPELVVDQIAVYDVAADPFPLTSTVESPIQLTGQRSLFLQGGAPFATRDWGRWFGSLDLSHLGSFALDDFEGETVGIGGTTAGDWHLMRELARAWGPAGTRGEWLVVHEGEGTDVHPTGRLASWYYVDGSIARPARDPGQRYVALKPEVNTFRGRAHQYTTSLITPDGLSYYEGEGDFYTDEVTMPDGTLYAGDPTSFPVDVTLPDDGDAPE